MTLHETKIYPNPIENILYLNKEVPKLIVTDLIGKRILKHNNVSQMDLSGLQNGIYFITIEHGHNQIEIKKVVKGN